MAITRHKTVKELPTKLYRLSAGFAQRNNLPVYFVARPLAETAKAVYLYGRGTTETARMGVCMNCGRALTHPVSVELGIGPICGEHYHNWDLIGGFSKENLKRLRQAVTEIKIDAWIPKACVKEAMVTKEKVAKPKSHPVIKRSEKGKEQEEEKGKRASQITFQKTGRPAIKIEFPFSHETLAEVKKVPGRRFHDEGRSNKYWTAPLSSEAIRILEEAHFRMDKKLTTFAAEQRARAEATGDASTTLGEIEVPGLKLELYPFQKVGVSFMESRNGRMLLGDEQGLGKTVQALAWLHMHPDKRPAVVVCPGNAKFVWPQQGRKFLDPLPDFQVLSGRKPSTPIVGEIVIINYDILPGWVDHLKEIRPEVLITDECQYYKNNRALRTKAVKKLAKGIPHFIATSGTPAVNRPIELYNAINLIDPTLFPDFWTYAKRYCGAYYDGYGWNFRGATNSEELHEILVSSIMLRRLKADVLKDLPAKVRSVVPVELTNEKEYRKAERNFIAWVREHKGIEAAKKASNAQALVQIEGLKQLAVKGKMKQATSWIKDFIDTDRKLVVFATHKATINALMAEFGNIAVKIDGSVSASKREKIVEAFQTNDHIRLFVGNIRAAGTAITLTAASSVAFVEVGWTPGEHSQAEDRIHRIGQEADSVNIYYLLAAETIEEDIVDLIDRKRRVLDRVLDGRDSDEASLLSELLRQYDGQP